MSEFLVSAVVILFLIYYIAKKIPKITAPACVTKEQCDYSVTVCRKILKPLETDSKRIIELKEEHISSFQEMMLPYISGIKKLTLDGFKNHCSEEAFQKTLSQINEQVEMEKSSIEKLAGLARETIKKSQAAIDSTKEEEENDEELQEVNDIVLKVIEDMKLKLKKHEQDLLKYEQPKIS